MSKYIDINKICQRLVEIGAETWGENIFNDPLKEVVKDLKEIDKQLSKLLLQNGEIATAYQKENYILKQELEKLKYEKHSSRDSN